MCGFALWSVLKWLFHLSLLQSHALFKRVKQFPKKKTRGIKDSYLLQHAWLFVGRTDFPHQAWLQRCSPYRTFLRQPRFVYLIFTSKQCSWNKFTTLKCEVPPARDEPWDCDEYLSTTQLLCWAVNHYAPHRRIRREDRSLPLNDQNTLCQFEKLSKQDNLPLLLFNFSVTVRELQCFSKALTAIFNITRTVFAKVK